MHGFGFLTATYKLTPLGARAAEEGGGLEEDGEREVVEIEGTRYARTPVRIGDIFVHQQKIHLIQGSILSELFAQNFTVGAGVYFRADWGINLCSLQAVDVRLLVRPGSVRVGGETSLDSTPLSSGTDS
ncbi:unnamed protein product [Phytomonas sp. Hart1]|nr:unnamed protein product [Phytomonas sp. Hart1]|eukprot:CCW71583.1 unnamed protein product [Phytomonas sp. isolate Hart1]